MEIDGMPILIRNILATFEFLENNIDLNGLYNKLQRIRGVQCHYEPGVYPALFIYHLEMNDDMPGRFYGKRNGVACHIYSSGCVSIMGATSIEQMERCAKRVRNYIGNEFLVEKRPPVGDAKPRLNSLKEMSKHQYKNGYERSKGCCPQLPV